MSEYTGVERRIARALESHPRLRDAVRYSYKRLVYLRHRSKTPKQLEPGVRVTDVALHCGVPDSTDLFFGYYDKSPWDATGRYYLLHARRGDDVEVVVCDLEERTHRVVGRTRAWNFQQGAMAQWLDESTVVYNRYEDSDLGLQISNDEGSSFAPYPIQCMRPGGHEYLSLNYRRLSLRRPDYGYPLTSRNFAADQDYAADGLWLAAISGSSADLIVSLEQLRDLAPVEYRDSDHWVNHCMFSPSGDTAVFLHRWTGSDGLHSRLYKLDVSSGDLEILLDERMVSHYSWVNDDTLVTWARTLEFGDTYHMLSAADGAVQPINDELSSRGDGHPTVDPSRRWIVTDTYPDKGRMQTLSTFDLDRRTTAKVARFESPWAFDGPERCDLHPRWHPHRHQVSIDSAHSGTRRTYIVDLGEV